MQKKPDTSKKYEFTGKTELYDIDSPRGGGVLMREITALRDPDNVHYVYRMRPSRIETSKNLSQIGSGLVHECFGRAIMTGNNRCINTGVFINISVANTISTAGKITVFQRLTLRSGISRYLRS